MGPLIRVLFAPDYQLDNPYQRLLAESLKQEQVAVEFLSGYRRIFPLARALAVIRPQIFHLHWPEHYFKFGGPFLKLARRLRYPLDLRMGLRGRPLAVTAHNLKAHGQLLSLDPLIRLTLQRAHVVFAHSESAKVKLIELAEVNPEIVTVIPHGDLAAALPPLPAKPHARSELKLPAQESIALVFGRVSPYKGIEELIDFWVKHRVKTCLLIAGEAVDRRYEAQLQRLAESNAKIRLRLHDLADEELVQLLSAADCAVFNYSDILTSGSACLARSVGLPLLIPNRLKTVDLAEPSPRVFHFERLDEDFLPQLDRAVAIGSDYTSAAGWRATTSWSEVARKTAAGYSAALTHRPAPRAGVEVGRP